MRNDQLYYHRKRGDIIFYQIFHGLIDVNPVIFSPTQFDIIRNQTHTGRCTRSCFFSVIVS